MEEYDKFPDGTIVVLRNGEEWVKGPHPTAKHVRTYCGGRTVAWRLSDRDTDFPDWANHKDGGMVNDSGRPSPWDVVAVSENNWASVRGKAVDALAEVRGQTIDDFLRQLREAKKKDREGIVIRDYIDLMQPPPSHPGHTIEDLFR